MNKYRLTYSTFYDVVEAESEAQAVEYFLWITGGEYEVKVEGFSDEIPSFFCPSGWTRPESIEEARTRCYKEWTRRYLGDFLVDGRLEECTPELEAFLIGDGWEKTERTIRDSEFDDFGFNIIHKQIKFLKHTERYKIVFNGEPYEEE